MVSKLREIKVFTGTAHPLFLLRGFVKVWVLSWQQLDCLGFQMEK